MECKLCNGASQPIHVNYYICNTWFTSYIVCESHLNTTWWTKHYQNNALIRKKVGNRVYECNTVSKKVIGEKKVGNRVYTTYESNPITRVKKVGNRVYNNNYYDCDY